jgi:hypothetical protein
MQRRLHFYLAPIESGVMPRPNFPLLAIFSAFSLLVLGQPALPRCEDCLFSYNVTGSFQSSTHSCSDSLVSCDLSARRLNSRTGQHSSNLHQLLLIPVFPLPTVAREPASSDPQPDKLVFLSCTWQFSCRAAPLPRAPSSLS